MRKALSIVALLVLVASSFGSMAAAADPADPGLGHHRRSDGAGVLARYVRLNMAAQSIAQITGQPVEVIRDRMQQQPLPDLLAEYHVNWKEFFNVMNGKVRELLGKLVENNYLTAEQRDRIIARMDRSAQRRALMKSLIDKGVQEGTITPEQAHNLLGRPL